MSAAAGGVELAGARCLITGGAGMIGSAVCDQLLAARAREIVVVDNLVRGRRANLAGALAAEVDLSVGLRRLVAWWRAGR
nr:NAD-dependent epimerase/dehydratase family protein [Pseudofrankia sp. DC12]